MRMMMNHVGALKDLPDQQCTVLFSMMTSAAPNIARLCPNMVISDLFINFAKGSHGCVSLSA